MAQGTDGRGSADHYAVLGVDSGADAATVRRRYLELARRHHPDRAGDDPAAVADAEATMRAVNAAWVVLGDAGRRAAYDRERRLAAAGPAGSAGPGPARRPATGPVRRTAFRAFDDEPPEADRDERFDKLGIGDDLTDESAGSGVRPPRWLTVAPPALAVAAFGSLSTGVVTSFTPLLALGLAAAVLAVLAFVAAPVVTLFRSRTSELD